LLRLSVGQLTHALAERIAVLEAQRRCAPGATAGRSP
jgi:hypothetical protein